MITSKKKGFAVFILLLCTLPVFCQPTRAVTDPEKKWKEAGDLFAQKEYALAYPLFKELKQAYPTSKKSDHLYVYENVLYYYIACELQLQLPVAAADARQYIDETTDNPSRTEQISFYLAHYYFAKEDFSNALRYYEQAGLGNLSNEEIADAQFEKAYAYFNLKRFTEARPLFNAIHQLPHHKYYFAANYYYGFICFYYGDYNEALSAFNVVQNKPEYQAIVPYYIAEILYFQGKKEEALHYGEQALAGNNLYYEKEMKRLIGQIYFERKEFGHALPLIAYYVSNTDKVHKEDVYELSYCYLQTGNLEKATEGFKQLSNEKDSLGQNSMYLLGDCYLRLNQKENARNAFQYGAFSSNNTRQKEISLFNYAKLSYELGYQDIALNEMKHFLNSYPQSANVSEAKEILVNLLTRTSNFTDALALYQSLGRPTPAMQKIYPRILYGKAMEYLNDQQISKANDLLNSVLREPASAVTPYAYFWKGEIAYRLNNYDSAIHFLRVFLQDNHLAQGDANMLTAKYDLGYSYLKKENYKEALSCFEPVAQASPGASAVRQDAFIRLADCHYMTRNFSKAGSLYETAIDNALPQGDYALFQKAMIAGIKNTGAKITLLNSLVKQYPQSSMVTEATMEVAKTYIADEQFREAIPYLNKIIDASSDEGMKPSAYAKAGLCYYNLNDDTDAIRNYTQLLLSYPSSPEADDAMLTVKRIFLEQGQPNRYFDLMRQAGKNVSPQEADQLTYSAAELKYDHKDCTGAVTAFKAYLDQFPNGSNSLDAHFNMAECYAQQQDWSLALEEYAYVNQQGINKYFERATLSAASIYYIELKNYDSAEVYFESLRTNAVNQDKQLEALRGLVRCYYQLKDYTQANTTAEALLKQKGISADDKSIAFLVLGKSYQEVDSSYTEAINAFKSCAAINKAAWGAEARYEIAHCYFMLNNIAAAQKAAMAVIKETGSYDYWVTSAYLLMGDIFMSKKDYFNAKATYQSVAQNAVIPELKEEAQQKLDAAIEEEKAHSKIDN